MSNSYSSGEVLRAFKKRALLPVLPLRSRNFLSLFRKNAAASFLLAEPIVTFGGVRA